MFVCMVTMAAGPFVLCLVSRISSMANVSLIKEYTDIKDLYLHVRCLFFYKNSAKKHQLLCLSLLVSTAQLSHNPSKRRLLTTADDVSFPAGDEHSTPSHFPICSVKMAIFADLTSRRVCHLECHSCQY
jgi:hypothetical protein